MTPRAAISRTRAAMYRHSPYIQPKQSPPHASLPAPAPPQPASISLHHARGESARRVDERRGEMDKHEASRREKCYKKAEEGAVAAHLRLLQMTVAACGKFNPLPGGTAMRSGEVTRRLAVASKGRGRRWGEVRCSAFGGRLVDQYRTLRVQPGASEAEIKRAFRRLALQYHPDVCKGSNCSVQFHRINEAYSGVMSSLRRAEEEEEQMRWSADADGGGDDEGAEWELWEEWMGWEGAGIRDYSSHINPFI